MPADAVHRHDVVLAVGRALSARHGPRRADRRGDGGAARGPRRRCGAKAAADWRSSRSARCSSRRRKIADRLDATLVNMRFVKPLDEELVMRSRRGTARS